MNNYIYRQVLRKPIIYRYSVLSLQSPTPAHSFPMKRKLSFSNSNTLRQAQENLKRVNSKIKCYSTTAVRRLLKSDHQRVSNSNYKTSQEQEMTEREKEWTISEANAKLPQIFRPFLYFLAIGASSFLCAAWLNARENDKTAQFIKANPQFLGHISTLTPYYVDRKSLDSLDIILRLTNHGDCNSSWGDLNEEQFRDVKKKKNCLELFQAGFLNKLLQTISYQIGIMEVSRYYTSIENVVRVRIVELPDELQVGLKIIPFTAAVLVGVKLSKSGKVGKNTYDYLRRHIMHTPAAANRFYTLTTSAFTPRRSLDLIKYLPVFFLVGSMEMVETRRSEGITRPHVTEATTLYHLLAFCVTAGTFGNVFTNAFIRVLLRINKARFGPQTATKLIGRVSEFGIGGMAFGIMATSASHIGARSEEDYKRDKIKPLINLEYTEPLICLGLISVEAIAVFLTLLDRRFAYGTERISRLGGAMFGFIYVNFGISLWEKAKSLFSEENEQILVSVVSRLAEAIDDQAPAEAQNQTPCYSKSEPIKS